MFDYQIGFWVLFAFFIGVCFDDWLKYQKTLKECNKCHGKGYVGK